MSDQSPFRLAAPALHARGYSVIPLTPGQKYPAIDRWSEFCSRRPTDGEHADWLGAVSANAGLCLGPASGVLALDFDDDVDGLHAAILAAVPDSPVKKRGAKGFTAFYRHTGERSHGYSVGGTRVLDVLATGRQTVLPPSIHPSGGAYEWITPATLADVRPDELPLIPAAAMARVTNLLRPEPLWQRPRPAPARHTAPAGDELLQAAHALRCIPADDYDVWIRMGMAIKQHFGERGFDLWDEWSATSGKYSGAEMGRKWASFRRDDITLGSLYHLAREHGYLPPPADREPKPRATLDIRPFAAAPVPGGGGADPIPYSPPAADLLNPPGLVGRIAAWVNATSIYPQPTLAVAAAITAAGIAMGHKVQSPTRLRTNFYALGLAPSGAGKDHARDCVTTLLCRAGMEGLVGGTPASGAGMLTALREGGGRCLVLWDEFGRVLKNLTHKNAGSHQRDILTYLIELFSSAKGLYAGVQYANHDGKMKRTPIDQPCLSVYATTVPERFFQCLTSDDAIDGFLARWLVLESTDYTLKPAKGALDVNDPPDGLVAELKRWREAPSNYDPRGNVDGVLAIRPMTVSYSDDAEALIDAYGEAMRRRAADEAAARSGLSAIYARCAEHAIKLALVAHEGDQIGADAMRWGIAAADHCAAFLIEAVKSHVAESDHERSLNKVRQVIRDRKGEWVETRALLLKTRNLKSRERNDILADLIEAGEVEREEVAGTTKPGYRYRAVGR